MAVSTPIPAQADVAGLALAAGSRDFYYDKGALVCNDVTQAQLDAAAATYDHLSVAKVAACRDVDAYAGSVRTCYISPGALVEQEYLRAVSVAAEWIAAGEPSNAVPSAVQSWADATGMPVGTTAADIVAANTMLNSALDAIRAARLLGKAEIRAAVDLAAVEVAKNAAIAALDACGPPQ